MSKKGRRAVLLTKDGVFKKVKLRKSAQVSIGEEIFLHHLSSKTVHERQKWLAMVAICLSLLFLFVLSGGVYEPRAAAAYVSFDVNPSVEASIDQNLRIIKVRPLNKAAETLLGKTFNYRHMPLSQFTAKLAVKMKSAGYFADHPELVVTTTVTDYADKEKRSKILNGISLALQKLKSQQVFVSGEGTIRTLKASEKKRNEAHSKGLSTGKYLIYKEAVKENQPITLKNAKTMTVKEIDQNDKKTVSNDQSRENQSNKTEQKAPMPLTQSSHHNHSFIHRESPAAQHKKKNNENASIKKEEKQKLTRNAPKEKHAEPISHGKAAESHHSAKKIHIKKPKQQVDQRRNDKKQHVKTQQSETHRIKQDAFHNHEDAKSPKEEKHHH